VWYTALVLLSKEGFRRREYGRRREVRMTGIHDRGGSLDAGPIDKSQHEIEDWERLADAVTIVLDKKGLKTTDEHRRAIESLDPEQYENLRYYERWIAATELLLVEKNVLTREEIEAKTAELERSWGEG
jgi:hypothetical protein